MNKCELSQMTSDELDAMETELQDAIVAVDMDQDAVAGHDLRCLLDRVVDQKAQQV